MCFSTTAKTFRVEPQKELPRRNRTGSICEMVKSKQSIQALSSPAAYFLMSHVAFWRPIYTDLKIKSHLTLNISMTSKLLLQKIMFQINS